MILNPLVAHKDEISTSIDRDKMGVASPVDRCILDLSEELGYAQGDVKTMRALLEEALATHLDHGDSRAIAKRIGAFLRGGGSSVGMRRQ